MKPDQLVRALLAPDICGSLGDGALPVQLPDEQILWRVSDHWFDESQLVAID